MLKEEAGRTAISLPPHLLGYAAAIIDHCTFTIYNVKNTISYTVQIHGDRYGHEVSAFMKHYFGASALIYNKDDSVYYKFSISNKADIQRLLRALMPYIIVKKKQAEIMLTFLDYVSDHNNNRHMTEDVIKARADLCQQLNTQKLKERHKVRKMNPQAILFLRGTAKSKPEKIHEEDLLGSLF